MSERTRVRVGESARNAEPRESRASQHGRLDTSRHPPLLLHVVMYLRRNRPRTGHHRPRTRPVSFPERESDGQDDVDARTRAGNCAYNRAYVRYMSCNVAASLDVVRLLSDPEPTLTDTDDRRPMMRVRDGYVVTSFPRSAAFGNVRVRSQGLIFSARWRRWWVRKINQRRVQQGVYNNLFRELYFTDEEQFFEYTRMNIRQFDYLFSLIGPLLQKKSMREPLSPRLRLVVTLSYLASGDSLKYLSKYYRIGASTIYKVIPETCESIWQALSPLFLKAPTVKKWSEIAEHFYNRWNLPNCVGALDGKHIRMQCPPHSGTEYFNYKKYFSLVLMACCDANYCFTWVEVGDYGSLPDSSIFGNSGLGIALETKSLNLPSPKELPGTNDKIPHFFVGDEAFPLRPDLMRPYSKKGIKSDTERIFNYRLSRARRIIENAFGILSSRWRVLHTCINMKVENVEKIVLATICLHNFMMMREDREVERRMYCPTTYIDNESDSDGTVTPGTWRDAPACSNLCDFGRLGSNNATRMAMTQRTTLAEWMLTDKGQVPWQFQMILRGYNVHFPLYD